MNGQFGIVTNYNEDRARYLVHMVSTQTTTGLKPDNLVRASTLEQYRAQISQLKNYPRVRQQLSRYYNQAAARLPVKPQVGAAIVVVLLIGAMYLVGFTRTITILSLVLLLGTIAAPDLMAGGDVATTARNFSSRCRETLEQTVPAARGRISNRVAFGLVLVMVVMVTRSIVPVKRQQLGSRELPQVKHKPTPVLGEDAYKMGYDDAIAGKPFGASLKQDAAVPRGLAENLHFDYDDIPPPPSSRKPKFGFSTAMSAFFIFRTIKEVGTIAGGGFDYQHAIVNLRMMEPWKMGLLAFSVYNVVRSIL